jgi:hypothetical protein
MGRKGNQLSVYLLVAALIFGSVNGYVLGLRTSQEMLTRMNQLESELALLKEEFTAYSGRDWHLSSAMVKPLIRTPLRWCATHLDPSI